MSLALTCSQCGGSSLGLLDMPGFENLKGNSFEQLCINVANEQLQHFFSEHIFVHERRECERDGVRWKHVQHNDNQNILDLFLAVSLFVCLSVCMCVCACVRECVRACVSASVRVCVRVLLLLLLFSK